MIRSKFKLALFLFSFLGSPVKGQDQEIIRGSLTIKLLSSQPIIRRHFDVQMDPEFCGKSIDLKEVLLGPKSELQHALVWLEGENLKSEKFNPPTTPRLDIKSCSFDKAFVFAGPKQVLSVTSQDRINFDLQFKLPSGKIQNRSLPPNLKDVQIEFDKAGIVEVNCSLHPWMKAFIVIPSHAFFGVTNELGEVLFDGVPTGEYKLHLWHQTLGRKVLDRPIRIEKGRKTSTFRWEEI